MEEGLAKLKAEKDKNVLLEKEIKKRQDDREKEIKEISKMKQFYADAIESIDRSHN